MKRTTRFNALVMSGMLLAAGLTACSDSDSGNNPLGPLVPGTTAFGQKTGNFSAEEWFPGGQLGTAEGATYSAFTPAVSEQLPNGEADFKHGEDFFEHLYTLDTEPRRGLGPAWVRSSCIHCHPGYGHGKRMEHYRANDFGNGYLLVIYHPTAGTDADGVSYGANSYIRHVTGMPQTKAMSPFKAPIDENQIELNWPEVTSMPSQLASYDAAKKAFTFPDGETFTLIYPEVNIPQSAFNTIPKPDNYEVRLESTIGIYGTGLLDAISFDDMKEQYQREAQHVQLNPAMWDAAANDWAPTAWYTLADGTKGVKKFTYAMTRTSLQDGAGANAIWNITNVTRSDRHYLYSTKQWAKAMSEDPEVISAIKQQGADTRSLLHPYYADGTDEGIKERVNLLLGLNTAADAPVFKQYFVDGAPYYGTEEMSDKDYYDFMVWHRGLAVPAARNLDDADVQRGKQLFNDMGCATCHRPSWTTGSDNYWVDYSIKAHAAATGGDASKMLPRYPNQTIWPYTDMVQHRLFMKNDIRTGWCRTTPLWGRGLSLLLTGAEDRLHDCRARNEIEAIMWHGYSSESDAYAATQKFYRLPKADRDAVVKFLRAI